MVFGYVAGFALLLFIPQFLGLQPDLPFDDQVETAKILLILHEYIWLPLLIVVLIAVVHLFYQMVVISHRTAGPMYRLNKHLEAMTEGDLSSDVRLRKKDHLTELETAINRFTQRIRSDLQEFQQLKAYSDELEKLADSLHSDGKEKDAQFLREFTAKLGGVLNHIRLEN